MRKMKETEVAWLNFIPENWECKRLKNVLKERKENNNPKKTDNILSLTNDKGVIPYSEKGNRGNKAKDDLTGYKLAYPNDIVMNSMNVVIGSVGLSQYYGCVSPVYYMLYSDKYDIRYYNYIFQSKIFQNELRGLGNGILEIRMRIPMEKMNNVIMPIPPRNEQEKIANFLDRKIAEIDNVTEKTKETIEDYKKYKQSVITEAVTKGLSKNVEMKDSKINWIGNIPKQWSIQKLKNITKLKTGTTPSTQKPEWFDGNYNWFTPSDFNENYIMNDSSRKLSKKAKEDDAMTIIPANSTMIIGIGGTAGKIGYVTEECSCNQQITALITDKVYNKYIMYWMIANTKYLKETAMYTTLPIINNETLGRYLFINPNNIEEEKRIVEYLDKKCIEINNLISNKQKMIEELEQYKKSLIYEYVTGKKEVI